MGSRLYAPRAVAVVGVVILHAGALLFLLETSRKPRPSAGTEPVLVMLLLGTQRPVPPVPAPPLRPVRQRTMPRGPGPITLRPSPPPAPSPPAPTVDWSAEAARAAARAAGNDQQTKQRTMGAPPTPDARFATRAQVPGFRWHSERTLELLPEGLTVLHLGNHCALAFWLFIPMAGCALGKLPPARDDLFQHMDDPSSPQP